MTGVCLMRKPDMPEAPVAAAREQAPDGGSVSEAMRRRITDRTRGSATVLAGQQPSSAGMGGAVAGKTLLGQ